MNASIFLILIGLAASLIGSTWGAVDSLSPCGVLPKIDGGYAGSLISRVRRLVDNDETSEERSDIAIYVCTGGLQLMGNSTVYCQQNIRRWTTIPQCVDPFQRQTTIRYQPPVTRRPPPPPPPPPAPPSTTPAPSISGTSSFRQRLNLCLRYRLDRQHSMCLPDASGFLGLQPVSKQEILGRHNFYRGIIYLQMHFALICIDLFLFFSHCGSQITGYEPNEL